MKEQIVQFRAFNRYYTMVIGLLDKSYLDSGFSLTEVRILYEVNYGDGITAKQLAETLKIDKGYLSRMLLQFEKKGVLQKQQAKDDGRIYHLRLTKKGSNVFTPLDAASAAQAGQLLRSLNATDRKQLLQHMQEIKTILHKANINGDE